jgi:hypothetical protein
MKVEIPCDQQKIIHAIKGVATWLHQHAPQRGATHIIIFTNLNSSSVILDLSRFFTSSWEQRKLGELCERFVGILLQKKMDLAARAFCFPVSLCPL